MGQRFELNSEKIGQVKNILVSVIEKEHKILFAYLHGSFGNLPFRDIDIGAYCEIGEDEVFGFEIEMGPRLELAAGYPVDFKVLNDAPLAFQFSVINEGVLLFERDRGLRLDFLEKTGMRYMDYSGFSRSYLRELVECTRK